MRDGWPSHLLNLLASSPAFLDPRPADWPAWHQLCGFLELPSHEHESVSPEVERFLASGAAPVFMGFGSLMPTEGEHLEATVATFEEAARIAGCRAIVQAEIDPTFALGASGDAQSDVLFVRRTPHKLVFPRCAAVVHHCGAGTTHTTLRAGAPSVPVPHVSDQFAWAEELQRLGAAPKMLRRTAWNAKKLASRIREVIDNPKMKQAAMAMSARMRSDNGPGDRRGPDRKIDGIFEGRLDFVEAERRGTDGHQEWTPSRAGRSLFRGFDGLRRDPGVGTVLN